MLLAVGVMLSFVVALVGFTALAVSQRAVNGLITATRILPGRFRPLAAEIIRGFVEGLGTLNSPRKHVTLFLISLPVWLAEAGVYLILAYSFDLYTYFPSFWLLALAVLLVMVTSNLVTAIPASVGGIGPFEVVAQQTLVGPWHRSGGGGVLLGSGASGGVVAAGESGGSCAVATAQPVAARVDHVARQFVSKGGRL